MAMPQKRRTQRVKMVNILKEASMSRLVKHMLNEPFAIVSAEISMSSIKKLQELGKTEVLEKILEVVGAKDVSELNNAKLKPWNNHAIRLLKEKAKKGFINVKGWWQYEATGEMVEEKNPIFVVQAVLNDIIKYAQESYQEGFIFGDTKDASLYTTTDYENYAPDDKKPLDAALKFAKTSGYDRYDKPRKTGQKKPPLEAIPNIYGSTQIKGKLFSIRFYDDISEAQSNILDQLAKYSKQIIRENQVQNFSKRNIIEVVGLGRGTHIPVKINNNKVYYVALPQYSRAIAHYRNILFEHII